MQNTFMPPAIVVAAVLLIGLFCDSPASWASFHDYLEIKAENAKIEENYRDWLERRRKHQRIIDTSSHSKISRWRTHLQAVHFGDERQGLQRLNTMVNEDVVYRDDYSHFHVRDYWSEPDIVLEEGGDCEDIALLKAASLLRLNWPAERMQLLVGYLTDMHLTIVNEAVDVLLDWVDGDALLITETAHILSQLATSSGRMVIDRHDASLAIQEMHRAVGAQIPLIDETVRHIANDVRLLTVVCHLLEHAQPPADSVDSQEMRTLLELSGVIARSNNTYRIKSTAWEYLLSSAEVALRSRS